MRLSHLHTKQFVFVSACGLLLAGFVAAQTPPLVRSAARPVTVAQSSTSATPSPTPSPSLDGMRNPPPQSGRREMARYEKGGPFSVSAAASKQEREAVMSQARAFLLAKWRGRRLGHFVLQLPDAEGRPTPSAFYVEQGEGGRWFVVLETAGGMEKFSFVEEVDVAEDGTPVLSPAAEDARRGPAVRRLHLKERAEANSGLVF